MSEYIYTASITGIDGSGKTTTVNSIAKMLSNTYSIGVLASIRNQSYFRKGEVQKNIFPRVSSRLTSLYENSQSHNLLVLLTSICHVVLQGRLVEQAIIRKYKPDLILRDRDRLVDSMVLFEIYSGWSNIPFKTQTIVVETFGGKSSTDNLFLLTANPKIAYERAKPAGQTDYHESVETLERMADTYPVVINALISLGRIKKWESIDTEQNSQSDVSQKISETILSRINF